MQPRQVRRRLASLVRHFPLLEKGWGVPERDCLGLREKIKKFQGLRDISVTKVITLQEEGTEFDSQNPVLFRF